MSDRKIVRGERVIVHDPVTESDRPGVAIGDEHEDRVTVKLDGVGTEMRFARRFVSPVGSVQGSGEGDD